MNAKELRDLIDFIVEKDIAEFELERGDVKVRIKRGAAVQYAPVAPTAGVPMIAAQPASALASASPAAVGGPAPRPAETEAGLHLVTSPIVGTYYEAPSP